MVANKLNNTNSSNHISDKSLYPDILFHFTNKVGLYGILEKNSFKPSYSREQIVGPKDHREFAVPIVSFCDLKMSELKNHMEKYGKYGIGLTKKWANKNGLSPVMYVNRHCQFADRFNSALASIYKNLSNIRDKDQNEQSYKNYMNVWDTYRYLKNYEGNLERNEKDSIIDYRFADEREWRYVPPWDTKGIEPFVAKSNIDTKKKKDDYNKKLDGMRLEFDIDDVKYLIVENESDVIDLIKHINQTNKGKINDTGNSLIYKILTSNQIERDM